MKTQAAGTMLSAALFLALTAGCGDEGDDDDGDGAAGADSGTTPAENQQATDEARANLTGDIEFSPPSQTFQGQISVSISTDLTNVDLHYTVDGEPPTASSPVYAGAPIPIDTTAQLRVQAFLGSQPAGQPGTAVYVARAFDVSLDVPILLMDNYGEGDLDPNNRVFVDSAFMTFGLEGGAASLSATPAIATRAAFHIRGQSTASFDKRPYRVELRDNEEEDADWPVFGLPAESDWALRGPFADKALIRDAFIYGLGQDMGMQAPRWAFCEFYLNVDSGPVTEDDYQGVYLVVETIKNSRNRLDLAQLREDDISLPDITGGYIFKFEWMAAEEPVLTGNCSASPCWGELEVVDPSPLNSEQEIWLSSHIQTFHDLLHASNYADPTSGYASLIDVDSFVDQLIINELSREMDSYIRSAVFYKDRDSSIFAGPLWDYNLTFGVGGFFENDQTAGWQYEQERQDMNNDWFPRLVSDSAFRERIAARWQALRQGLLSDAEIDARINRLTIPLVNAANRNFERWPNLSDRNVVMFVTPTDPTWAGQVEFMRDWMLERAAWLDTQWS